MLKDLKTLFNYHDLLFIFIWRNLNIRYRQSYLGFLWAVFQPLSLMVLFCAIFNNSNPLFFLTGLLCWNFFSSTVSLSITSLTSQYSLITRIYFPREILPLSLMAVAFIDYLIAAAIFVIIAILNHLPVSVYAWWTIPLTLLLIMFVMAISLLFSSLNVYYRDLQLASNFLIQLLFFASPVFYNVSQVSPQFQKIIALNPLTFIINNMRLCLLHQQPVNGMDLLLMFIIITTFLFVSYRLFKIMEKRFADVI